MSITSRFFNWCFEDKAAPDVSIRLAALDYDVTLKKALMERKAEQRADRLEQRQGDVAREAIERGFRKARYCPKPTFFKKNGRWWCISKHKSWHFEKGYRYFIRTGSGFDRDEAHKDWMQQ